MELNNEDNVSLKVKLIVYLTCFLVCIIMFGFGILYNTSKQNKKEIEIQNTKDRLRIENLVKHRSDTIFQDIPLLKNSKYFMPTFQKIPQKTVSQIVNVSDVLSCDGGVYNMPSDYRYWFIRNYSDNSLVANENSIAGGYIGDPGWYVDASGNITIPSDAPPGKYWGYASNQGDSECQYEGPSDPDGPPSYQTGTMSHNYYFEIVPRCPILSVSKS